MDRTRELATLRQLREKVAGRRTWGRGAYAWDADGHVINPRYADMVKGCAAGWLLHIAGSEHDAWEIAAALTGAEAPIDWWAKHLARLNDHPRGRSMVLRRIDRRIADLEARV